MLKLNRERQTVTQYTVHDGIEATLNRSKRCLPHTPIGNVPMKRLKPNDNFPNNAALRMIMNENSSYLEKFSSSDIPVFLAFKCSFEDAIKILFAWSVGINYKDLSLFLDIEEYVVRYFYTICTQYAKKYISSCIKEWKIGGPDIVVLIDTYPEGCNKFNLERPSHNSSVLCLAEAKDIPPSYWFEILDGDGTEEKSDRALHIIRTVVRPGSILVTDSSFIFPASMLQKLKNIYPIVVCIDDLMHHNSKHQNLLNNLKVIWQPALLVCENGSYHTDTQSYYTSYLWNQRFGNDGLAVLLNQF